ncbi:metalloendopeptidase [Methanosarcina sp. 2.H.T.1A.6]|uniref:M23 family metallopeptidase n=1 Tax=unclassified Methanosarcina TaxID=2644672 RepID=UPI000621AC8F|nr:MULTISPECIES: M23 family metallopeptidase [unclassified Methanosarcina]KKG16888.1 metalloendopeptidase [Methanosarcina sp. 2.H.T.1A.3]KKG20423.1 metalloendopeptidase [Methanosarcina sp. 2.H.T.1A.8]KKG21319.1 metalloendopeptidase [Methanosarcina sp. 2.H.T.1A.15]KKG22508.1 metalloendopeptidase [Methanosarcina sp. 2.H.T.1A.6]
MKRWPLNPKIPEKIASEKITAGKIDPVKIPQKGEAGSFWEDRGDRYHCGVDLYAPENTEVFSIEEGMVTETGLMTSPEILLYWNPTYYVIIKNTSGTFCKYGELAEYAVQKGDNVGSGQLVGYVGMVLNCAKIDESSPSYIRKLKNKNSSMLHFELWKDKPITSHRDYLGGNWFSEEKPENLVDPTEYLVSIRN